MKLLVNYELVGQHIDLTSRREQNAALCLPLQNTLTCSRFVRDTYDAH